MNLCWLLYSFLLTLLISTVVGKSFGEVYRVEDIVQTREAKYGALAPESPVQDSDWWGCRGSCGSNNQLSGSL
jgi:hypothetical protein